MRTTFGRSIVFACVIATSIVAFAQAPKLPAFEVAAISPSPPLDIQRLATSGNLANLRLGMNVTERRVDITFLSLTNLMPIAFKVQPYQVSAPGWMNEARFDIHATIPQGGTREQVPDMLQALLIERFGMVAHREKRETNVYSLVVAKEGHKLTPAVETPAQAGEPNPDDVVVGQGENQVRIARGAGPNGAQSATVTTGRATMNMTMSPDGKMQMDVSRMTMEELVATLTQLGDRPVIDDTGLTGAYRVKLELALGDLIRVAQSSGLLSGLGGGGAGGAAPAGLPASGAADPSGSSIFETVQKLGMRLEPKKAPVDFVVIDKMEKSPTAN